MLMIRFRNKPISDEEYVEKLKRNIARSRKWGIVLSCLYIVLFIVALIMLQGFIHSVGNGLLKSSSFDSGWKLGIALGFGLGMMLFSVSKHLMDAIMMASGVYFSRMPRLLVRYYDLANAKDPQHQNHEAEPKGRA